MVESQSPHSILYHHYNLNIRLLSWVGLWPYITGIPRQIQNIVFSAILVLFAILQLLAIPPIIRNMQLLLKNTSLAIITLGSAFKYSVTRFQFQCIKEVMQRMQYNWRAIQDETEILIMKKHTSIGQYHTKVVASLIYSTAVIMAMWPHITDILDVVIPLNQSRAHQLPVMLATGFDQEKYFYFIALFMDFTYFVGGTTYISTETTTIACLQHTAALFEIVRYVIHGGFSGLTFASLDWPMVSLSGYRMKCMTVDLIIRLRFSAYLKTTFAPTYLALLILGVISLSINLLGVSRVLLLDSELLDLLVFGTFVFVEFAYMYYLNYMIQKVINSCSHISTRMWATEWYQTPVRIQRVILFIMLRSLDVVDFEVFGLFNPSIEGFASLMKLSLSYFTAISSI